MIIANRKLTYPISLILSTEGKKTAESLAKVPNKSGDTMLRLLNHSCVTAHDLVNFTTAKQSLGLTHCQSVKQKLQENHIMNVFGAYAILQFERRKRKLPNPEAALKRLKHKSYASLMEYLSSADQIFGGAHA